MVETQTQTQTNTSIIDRYISKSLNQITSKPIGVAKFKEPVFKLGAFQDRFIEVEVEIYPETIKDPNNNITLIGVRFGEMNILRFVDRTLIYDMRTF